MNSFNVASARLHENGELRHCQHCGCVWELWDDKELGLRKRRVGTFEGPGSEVGFTLFTPRTWRGAA